jgi:CPA2 family monovalent cation:H+ antiporter-2
MIPRLVRSFAVAAISLAAMFVLGTRLLPRVLKMVLAWGSRELFLVTTVTIGVGVGYAAHLVGLSFALGAFIAGIILSESEFSHQALSDVIPLRDVFGLLFFVSVGMLFDPAFVLAHALQIVVVVIVIFAGKALIIGGVTRLFGYANMAPWIVGLGLSQIGEFSFVLARAGFAGEFLSKSTYDLALTSTIVTMAVAPIVSSLALPLGRRWPARGKTARLPQPDFPTPKTGHVIVGGYGRSGRAVARALSDAKIDFIVVELDHALLGEVGAAGFSGLWGDVSREELLAAAHVERARMLLLTMPDPNTVHLAVDRALRLHPGLIVIARATRERQVSELLASGVAAAIQPEFEGGVEMVRQALVRSNYDEAATAAILDHLRKELYERLES